ncbi:ComEA family DNA-binding protein [Brumimicrobium mesophilum]|uniref:ComEA family DNA-binding protein n=1 Tax=Brumimicrobium mesophilum TaxID=392717 RepID=UPI00131B0E52|nr:helix-hairpin-helix domain-containing protein [Brumimicrobium mesophilum]
MVRKNWDSDWIHFSKRARRGIIVLLIAFVIVAVSPRLYYNYIHVPQEYEIQIRPLAKFEAEKNKLKVESLEYSRYTQPKAMFDPNDYTVEEWKNVGLSEKQAGSIINYLSSGAILKVKTDLKKLYVVDQELYDLLEPKIDLPEEIEELYSTEVSYKEMNSQELENEIEPRVEKTKVVSPISLNMASAEELKSIPGIGEFYAKEIIQLRKAYGGFVSHDQLSGIYGMRQGKLDSLKPFLVINLNELRKLDINKASEQQLRNHPLISYDIAKSIVYFRENYRVYKRVDEILLSPYIDRDKLKALTPYLKVD